ncbi:efflux RND transporter permease subunit [Leptospira sp. 201903071]|uniref:efflux RND transporter permease subunit n=1 Tax=Leptospira ainazelensis TaxID=2810034 RepID=UPI0019628B73|nr:efflux RND transporter permease subunit [Leptospira ainazelensis]MBM9502906.1 efflux RND transporter permease subunit [Leptospira ainazelensis]
MSNFFKNLLSKRAAILSFFSSLVLFGIVSLFDLKLAILPDIGFPKVQIETKFPFAGIEEVETLITKPLSERLSGARGVKQVTSISEPGVSRITITFASNQDLDFKILELREKIEQVREVLPQNSEKPILTRFDPSGSPFLELVFFPKKMENPIGLRKYLTDHWKPVLERIEGVASLQIGGGYDREILAKIDSKRMLSYNLSPEIVGRRIVLSNRNVPAGSVPSGDKEVLVRVKGESENLNELSDTVISVGQNGEVVRLKDFVETTVHYRKRSEKALFNGKECVIFYFYKESGANPIAVSEKILEEAELLYNSSREEIEYVNGYDEASYVKESIKGLRLSLVIGALLAFIVCLGVLRNFSTPLVLVSIVPVAVLSSFFFFWIFGLSLNMMSLGGLAVGIGMLFDNSNVVLSAIEKNHSSKVNASEAAVLGLSEVYVSVLLATLSTLFVFIPMIFLRSFIGSIFSEMALAISLSLSLSLLISLTLTPVLYSLYPKMEAKEGSRFDRFFEICARFEHSFSNWQRRSLEEILLNPKKLFWILITFVFVSGFSVWFVRKEILPQMETGEFTVSVRFQQGMMRERIEDLSLGIESYIKEKYPIEFSLSRIGREDVSKRSSGLTLDPVTEIRFILNSWNRRETAKIVEGIRTDLLNEFGNLETSVKFSGDVLSSLLGKKNEIEVEIRGENLEELEKLGKQVQTDIAQVQGVKKVSMSLDDKTRSYSLKLDESKLLLYGWSTESVSEFLKIGTLGGYFSGLEIAGEEIPIRLVFRDEDIPNVHSFKNLFIPYSGKLVPLGELSTMQETSNFRTLYGVGTSRANFLNVYTEKNQRENVEKEISKLLEKKVVPSEITLGVKDNEDSKDVLFELLFTISMAYIILFLLIAGQFESITVACKVLLTVPFVIMSALPILVVTGKTLNASSFVGLILLMGISIDSAVLFYEYFLIEKKKTKSSQKAAKDASSVIIKPVLMNSATTIAGLLPVMLELTPGSEFQSSMALAVGFGIILSVLNALFWIPLLFSKEEGFKKI